jgi:hypothetical protein
MATRVYRVSDPKGMVHAHEEGRMEFHAPDTKRFVVTSEQGSGLVRRLVLNPLIVSEIGAAAGRVITPANYRAGAGRRRRCPGVPLPHLARNLEARGQIPVRRKAVG